MLTRAEPYGILTDDDGSGLVGEPWNNAFHQGFLDLLDARWSRYSQPATGTVTALSYNEADVVLLTNTSDVTYRSIPAPASPAKPGKRLILLSAGAGNVFLNHQDTTGTTAGARMINYATSGPTPLAAGTGAAMYVYDDNAARWRLVHHEQGAWMTRAFAAGNYTGSASMTWTLDAGDVINEAYLLRGRTLTYTFMFDTTTVGGTLSGNLQILVPGGFTIARTTYNALALALDSGSTINAMILAAGGATTFALQRYAIAAGNISNWTAATNTTYVRGQIIVEVQ